MKKSVLVLIILLFAVYGLKAENRNKLDSLIHITTYETKDTNYLKHMFDIGHLYEPVNLDSALLWYSKVVDCSDLFTKAESEEEKLLQNTKANALRYSGYVYKMQNNSDSALAVFKRAKEVFSEVGNNKLVGYCLTNIGNTYSKLGEFSKALEVHENALELFKGLEFTKGMIASYSNIGIIYNEQGSYDKAIEYYLMAAKLAEPDSNIISMAICYTNIGNVYYYQKNYNKAIEYHKKSLLIYEELNDEHSKIACYNNIAAVFSNIREFKLAQYYCLRSLSISEKLNDLRSMAYSYNILGDVFYFQEQFEKAQKYFLKSKLTRENLGDRNGIVISSINIVNCMTEQENYIGAQCLLKDIKPILEELNSISLMQMFYEAYKEYYLARKDFKQAYQYFELEQNMLDSTFNEQKHRQITELETKYQTEKKEQQIITLQKDNELQEQKVKNQQLLTLLIAVGSLLLIIVGLIYYRWNKTKQKNKQNELTIKNLLTEQKMLRGQMNPHFIYNSLNSIQAFISSDESYQAEKYLAQFAKLMRGILENSRADFVILEKEIEVLQLYLELEQLRFENRFTFEIKLDDELESEFLSIPPMLIQPFIENAILHGFTNRNNGKITISFAEKENLIECVIDDNGIGRKEAAKHKKASKHESLATKITQERLETLSTQMNVDAKFVITDKTNKNGESLGTKVELWIPISDVE